MTGLIIVVPANATNHVMAGLDPAIFFHAADARVWARA
jgi:hypothetical protein